MQTHASFWEAVAGAAQSLRASKLRSFLTLLGIILATTTLIAVMAVISGMDRYIAENVSKMGADGYRVTRIALMQWDPKKFLEMLRRNPQLSREEFEFLKSHTRLTSEIGMVSNRGVAVHVGKELSEAVQLMGVSPNVGLILNFEADEGRFLTDIENERHMAVAFIGKDLKDKFFSGTTAVGKTITAGGIPFQVIGVAKGKGSVFGQSQDNFLVIPVETYFKTWGSRSGMDYAGVAIGHNQLLQAQDEVRALLRAYRQQGPKEDDTFGIVTSDSL